MIATTKANARLTDQERKVVYEVLQKAARDAKRAASGRQDHSQRRAELIEEAARLAGLAERFA